MKTPLNAPEPDENPLTSIQASIAFSSRDWTQNHRDAWVYGIVYGYDARSGIEDTWDHVTKLHGWDPKTVARLKRLHAAFLKLLPQSEPAKGPQDVPMPDGSMRPLPRAKKPLGPPGYQDYLDFMRGYDDAEAGKMPLDIGSYPYMAGFTGYGCAAAVDPKAPKTCTHPEQFRLEGGDNKRLPRHPLLYGSAEVVLCTVCRSWAMKRHTTLEWEPGPYSEALRKARDEDDRC